MQAGFDISVAANSQAGFASDFNILYTSGTGQVGLWQEIARPTLAAWQNADFTDADSLALNPDFVNPLGSAGVAGFISPTDDGRDNDFHEQSLQGSYHGGSLAPVVSTTTGLPVFPTGTLTADANESPAIDLGDPTDSYSPTNRRPTAATSTSARTAIRPRPRSVRSSICSSPAPGSRRRGLAGGTNLQHHLAHSTWRRSTARRRRPAR